MLKWPQTSCHLIKMREEETVKLCSRSRLCVFHGSINATTYALAAKCVREHFSMPIFIVPPAVRDALLSFCVCPQAVAPAFSLPRVPEWEALVVMDLDDVVDQRSCARLHMMSCRWRYSTHDHLPVLLFLAVSETQDSCLITR